MVVLWVTDLAPLAGLHPFRSREQTLQQLREGRPRSKSILTTLYQQQGIDREQQSLDSLQRHLRKPLTHRQHTLPLRRTTPQGNTYTLRGKIDAALGDTVIEHKERAHSLSAKPNTCELAQLLLYMHLANAPSGILHEHCRTINKARIHPVKPNPTLLRKLLRTADQTADLLTHTCIKM